MHRRKNLLGKFFRLLPNYKEHILMLENSLQHTREMLDNRIKEVAALKNEQLYLYDILRRRNGCTIHIQLDVNRGLLLYTTMGDGVVNDTIVYLPRECLQIAEIITDLDGKVIHTCPELEPTFPFKPSKPLS